MKVELFTTFFNVRRILRLGLAVATADFFVDDSKLTSASNVIFFFFIYLG